MDNVAVLGAGSWGTALAIVLADNGHDVRLWGRREEQVVEINTEHRNERYLPDVVLPENIRATVNLDECIKDADTIVLVTPTKSMREVLGQLKKSLDRRVTIVHASKGIEPGTYKRISEIIEEELPDSLLQSVVVLSGPSHAEEVS
jgi:glycerol-3-phosphate dehydrogenase (NAD(P)+)